MREHKAYALFVTRRRAEPASSPARIFSTRRSATAVRSTAPIGPLAHRPVISVAPDDLVTTALLRMTKHNKRRLAVGENGQFVGMLEDIDLLSFLAGNSQLVAGRIDRSRRVADLARAAQGIEPQIRLLRRQGVKIDLVCEIVSDLNRRLHDKLFALVAPPSIREAGCFFVMGSEGRGEQTFRTDQDNGLILAAPVPEEDLVRVPRRRVRRARAVRLSALSGRSDGAQSGLVEDARRISRRFPPLARHRRTRRAR